MLAEDGKKMSKKLKNYPDPAELFATYGGDAYRLYLLASPGVRSEPVRFTEKAVEQIYKDFGAPLTNAFNFFNTYAQIDGFQDTNPRIFALSNHIVIDDSLVENLLRSNIDLIVSFDPARDKNTISQIQTLLKEYTNRDVASASFSSYNEILEQITGENVLLIDEKKNLTAIREEMYGSAWTHDERTSLVPLPHYVISNDLDRWIYAELHATGKQIEQHMASYLFDSATKVLLDFMDKLTNWFIRRSRRRFWASGMDTDKLSAYATLFHILEQYCRMAAPCAPFLTEHIWQQLQIYRGKENYTGASVHLEFFPVCHDGYINSALIEEISVVRRIISLGLFVRSKHKIKVKQPLEKLEVQME